MPGGGHSGGSGHGGSGGDVVSDSQPRNRPYVNIAPPNGLAFVDELIVAERLIAPPSFVDGTTILGSGKDGDPLRATGTGALELFYAQSQTIPVVPSVGTAWATIIEDGPISDMRPTVDTSILCTAVFCMNANASPAGLVGWNLELAWLPGGEAPVAVPFGGTWMPYLQDTITPANEAAFVTTISAVLTFAQATNLVGGKILMRASTADAGMTITSAEPYSPTAPGCTLHLRAIPADRYILL